LIFFDLEGPLSPQDNAYEVMSLIEGGDQLFEIISRYDDLIALEGREGYEPGDTLALIVPFLLLHGITDEEIVKVSDQAKIVDGVPSLISKLHAEGWKVSVISTSYEQHAYHICSKIGVERKNIACTRLRLDELKDEIKDFSVIRKAEEEILRLKDDDIVERLDLFYEDIHDLFRSVRVIGGERKVDAMLEMINGEDTSEVFVVGDSITDYKMLRRVRDGGGISIVFNGNEYAIPYANIGFASLDMRFLHILLSCEDKADVGGEERVFQKKSI
jgi:energy-converting hydrogenase A subunit R